MQKQSYKLVRNALVTTLQLVADRLGRRQLLGQIDQLLRNGLAVAQHTPSLLSERLGQNRALLHEILSESINIAFQVLPQLCQLLLYSLFLSIRHVYYFGGEVYGLEDISLDNVEARDGFHFALVGGPIVEIAVCVASLLDAVLKARLLVEGPVAGLGVAEGVLSVRPGTVSFVFQRVAGRCPVELFLRCWLFEGVKVCAAEVDGEDSAYFGGLLQVLAAGGREEFRQAAHDIKLLRINELYAGSSHLHADGRIGGLLVGLGEGGGFEPVGGLGAEFCLVGGGRDEFGVELALLAALAHPALAELNRLLLELDGLWLFFEVAGENGLGAGAFPAVGLEQNALLALHQLTLLLGVLIHFFLAPAPALELLAPLISLFWFLALVLLPIHVIKHVLLVLRQFVGLVRDFLAIFLLVLGLLAEDAVIIEHFLNCEYLSCDIFRLYAVVLFVEVAEQIGDGHLGGEDVGLHPQLVLEHLC